MLKSFCQFSALTAALTVSRSDAYAQSPAYHWIGRSNEAGGVVEYVASNPTIENSEDERFEIRCDGFDRRLTLSFLAENTATGDEAKTAIFKIDSDLFKRYGDLGNGGLYPQTPIIFTTAEDPLIAALMGGSSVQIYFGSIADRFPDYEVSLAGTRETFSRHLAACL